MARITDSIVLKGETYSQGSPTLNLQYGGQNGYLPSIGMVGPDGSTYEEWINNQAYVSRPLIPILLRPPKGLTLLPDSEKWIATYKAIMETHPTEITGFDSTLSVETDETEIGSGGEFQEEYTNVKRARTVITKTYKEKANKAIARFWDFYIRYLMKDPDANRCLISDYITNLDDIGGMYTADFYSGTMLYIEPDITMRGVVDAYLSANMFPKSNGSRVASRNIKAAGEGIDLSIEFSSITLNNLVVMELASTILEQLTVINKIPDRDLILPNDKIDSILESVNTGFNQ